MNQPIRVIKTQNEYDNAMSRLSVLMDIDLAVGSAEEVELELLTLVIESYEHSKVKPVMPDPIEAILFVMDQKKISARDLVPMIGSISKVSEVLSRKRPLSLAMIRALHKGLGIPADILINQYLNDGIDMGIEPTFDYRKLPWSEMKERGYFNEPIQKLKDYAEELFIGFIRELPGHNNHPVAFLRAPLHQNGAREMNDYALIAWHACVLKKAQHVELRTPYVPGVISDEWLRDLVKLSRFDSGPRLAKEFLADKGIALVVEKHFKKTYLDGAAMLMGDTPVIALTLRHDRLDNFWFALLHELEHVRKHLAEYRFIADNLDDKTRSSQIEREADEGARDALIPPQIWEQAKVKVTLSQTDAIELADQLRIHSAIVAGRVRKETNNWRLLSRLIAEGGCVSKHFENIF